MRQLLAAGVVVLVGYPKRCVVPAVALVVAFSTLFYMEHLR